MKDYKFFSAMVIFLMRVLKRYTCHHSIKECYFSGFPGNLSKWLEVKSYTPIFLLHKTVSTNTKFSNFRTQH
jgi:hypothetical protein